MRKKLFQAGILAFALVFGMTVIGCKDDDGGGGGGNGDGSYNNDAGELLGTWSGNIAGNVAIVTVSNSGWTVSATGLSDEGKFNRSGNSVTLYSNLLQKVTGTATITSPSTFTLVLNNNSIVPGTYYFTKQ